MISEGFSVIVRPPRVRNELGVWTWDIDKANSEKENLLVVKSRNGYIVKKRTFVSEKDVIKKNNKYWYNKNITSNSRSIIEYSTNEGSNVFNDIFYHSVKFDNPKNIDLIAYIIELYYKKNSIHIITSEVSITALPFFRHHGYIIEQKQQVKANKLRLTNYRMKKIL